MNLDNSDLDAEQLIEEVVGLVESLPDADLIARHDAALEKLRRRLAPADTEHFMLFALSYELRHRLESRTALRRIASTWSWFLGRKS